MKPKPIILTSSVDIAASGGKPRVRRFSLVAYTGGALKLPNYAYPVVVDLAGLDGTGRRRPALMQHDANRVVGHVEQMEVKDNTLTADGVFSHTGKHAKEVIEAADNGFEWQVSIGAEPRTLQLVAQGKSVNVNGRTFNGPVYVARQSTLRELSFVPIGADDNTAARIAAQRMFNMKRKMNTGAGVATAVIENDETEIIEADDTPTITAEQVNTIRAICRTDVIKAGRRVPVHHRDIEAQAIEEGWDVVQTARAVAARDVLPVASNVSRRRDNSGPTPDTIIEASLCLTAGVTPDILKAEYGERVVDAAMSREHRGATLHSALRHVIEAAGMRPTAHSGDGLIRTAFEADRTIRASGFSTFSLPGTLGNVANKSLLQSYNGVAMTWNLIASIASNSNFHPHTRYRLSGKGEFEQVGADGEIKHMTLAEQDYENQLATYAKMCALTRQDLINDDLGALTAVPRILGRKAAVKLEKTVYETLLGNAGSFFHANNSNLVTSTSLNIAGLTAAELKFLNQVDEDGDPMLLVPKVLLVPNALSATAATLMNSTEITSGEDEPITNPHAGKFTVAVSPWLSDARLTGYSATTWYLFAAPSDIAAIEVAFLNGRRQPTIESGDTDFNTLGMQWRGYWDFGVAFQDPRAAVKVTA